MQRLPADTCQKHGIIELSLTYSALAAAQDRAQLQAVATRLARAGASLEAADLEGRTALHLAAGCGDAAMVAHLLHLGADVNATDSVGGAAQIFGLSGRSLGSPRHVGAAHAREPFKWRTSQLNDVGEGRSVSVRTRYHACRMAKAAWLPFVGLLHRQSAG